MSAGALDAVARDLSETGSPPGGDSLQSEGGDSAGGYAQYYGGEPPPSDASSAAADAPGALLHDQGGPALHYPPPNSALNSEAHWSGGPASANHVHAADPHGAHGPPPDGQMHGHGLHPGDQHGPPADSQRHAHRAGHPQQPPQIQLLHAFHHPAPMHGAHEEHFMSHAARHLVPDAASYGGDILRATTPEAPRKRGRPPRSDAWSASPASSPMRPGTPPGVPLEIPAADGTPRGDFLHELYTFMVRAGQPITKTPHLGYQELDLFRLYGLVTARGGMDAVTRRQEWKAVYGDLGIPTMSTSASYNTRTNYKKYLYLYELEHFAPPPDAGGRPAPRFPASGTPVRIVSSTMEGAVFYARTVRHRWDDERGAWAYYVHYHGWSTSHDEWMPEDVLSPLLASEAADPDALANPAPSRSSKSNYIISEAGSPSSPAARRAPEDAPPRPRGRPRLAKEPAAERDSAGAPAGEERRRRPGRPRRTPEDQAEALRPVRQTAERPETLSAAVIREKLAALERDAAFTGGLSDGEDEDEVLVLDAAGVHVAHGGRRGALLSQSNAHDVLAGAPTGFLVRPEALAGARADVFGQWRERLSAAIDLRVPDVGSVAARVSSPGAPANGARPSSPPAAVPLGVTPALAALADDLRDIRRAYRRNRRMVARLDSASSGSSRPRRV